MFEIESVAQGVETLDSLSGPTTNFKAASPYCQRAVLNRSVEYHLLDILFIVWSSLSKSQRCCLVRLQRFC